MIWLNLLLNNEITKIVGHFLSIPAGRPTALLLWKHFCSSWLVTGSLQTSELCLFKKSVFLTVHCFKLNLRIGKKLRKYLGQPCHFPHGKPECREAHSLSWGHTPGKDDPGTRAQCFDTWARVRSKVLRLGSIPVADFIEEWVAREQEKSCITQQPRPSSFHHRSNMFTIYTLK